MAEDYTTSNGLALIHLIHPSKDGQIKATGHSRVAGANGGTFDIACSPGSPLPTHASSETIAVTCPLCKASEVFRSIEAEQTGNSLGTSAADRAIAKLMLEKAQRETANSATAIPE